MDSIRRLARGRKKTTVSASARAAALARADSSSSSAPPPFTKDDMIAFPAGTYLERYRVLANKNFLDYRYISWTLLRRLDCEREVRSLISHSFWQNVFIEGEFGWRELSLEFLSTFQYCHIAEPSVGENSGCKFRIMGEFHECSLSQLGALAGFYPESAIEEAGIADLPISLPEAVTPADLWRELTNESRYEARAAKSTRVISPHLRFLIHLIGHSLNATHSSSNVVGITELTYLYSFRARYPLHLGKLLASYFLRQASEIPKAIGGSHFISRIAKGLGLWERLPSDMVQVSRGTAITEANLIACRVAEKVREGENFRFYFTRVIPREPAAVVSGGHDDPAGGGDRASSGGAPSRTSRPPPQHEPSYPTHAPPPPRRSFEEDYPDMYQYMARMGQAIDWNSSSLVRLEHALNLVPPSDPPIIGRASTSSVPAGLGRMYSRRHSRQRDPAPADDAPSSSYFPDS